MNGNVGDSVRSYAYLLDEMEREGVSASSCSTVRKLLEMSPAERYAHNLTSVLRCLVSRSPDTLKDYLLPHEYGLLVELANREMDSVHVKVEELLSLVDRQVFAESLERFFRRLRV